MSFNVALSGLRAANQDLATTGNNIANASTIGFKRSRAEFADVYAGSVMGNGSRTPGSGVLVSDIAQQFGQGNISITNNSLDLAISGEGFFVLKDQGAPVYTRAGMFSVDQGGFIVGGNGARLQGFQADASGSEILSGAPGNLKIETADLPPLATTEANMTFNLDSREPVNGVVFNPSEPTTYNWSTAATVYDSLGNDHVVTTYYKKIADNQWQVYASLPNATQNPLAPPNDVDVQSLGTINFTASGGIQSGGIASTVPWHIEGGADPLTISFDFDGSTQHGSEFSINGLDQNGFAPGRLAGLSVSDNGIISGRYTNGKELKMGQVALANFASPQGLSPIGNTLFAASFDSGQAVVGAPMTASLGGVQSGALEDSNVDLSDELVNLIIAQRNYQANAKTIETANAVTQSIINLR